MTLRSGQAPQWTNIVINISLVVLSVIIFFSFLEIYARYKYWGLNLRDKGFYSRGKTYAPKRQTPVRIVCLGGSTTHGSGDIEHNETYPYFLEQTLNKEFGRNFVEVLNSGLPGTPTEYHRDFVKKRIDDQELDILIVHSFYNHFSSFYPGLYNPVIDKIFIEHGKTRTVYHWDKMNIAEIINVFLMEHSYFYTRFREKLLRMSKKNIDEYYRERRKYTAEATETSVHKTESEKDRMAILGSFVARYKNALEDIIAIAQSRKVNVVLIIPPYPFFERKSEDSFYSVVFNKGKQCLLELGRKHNLLVIDADNELLKRGRSRDLFLTTSTIHLTKKGNHILAEIIASKIIPYLKKNYKNKQSEE